MADRITLRGLRAVGHHGVFDFERRDGQEFVVDIVLHVDVAAAAATDALDDTVDYGAIAALAHARITGPPVALIERLAVQIAEDCLSDARVQGVEVTVHKPSAPIPMSFDDASVTVGRGSVPGAPGGSR